MHHKAIFCAKLTELAKNARLPVLQGTFWEKRRVREQSKDFIFVKNKSEQSELCSDNVVRMNGLEPSTPCMSSKYSNQLSYTLGSNKMSITQFYYFGKHFPQNF